MNDSFLMSVLNRLANEDKQLQARREVEALPVAAIRDALAPNQFHDEIRATVFRRAAVENPRNVGVIHDREGLAFGFEASDDGLCVHPELDDFECDDTTDGFLLLGRINFSTTPFA